MFTRTFVRLAAGVGVMAAMAAVTAQAPQPRGSDTNPPNKIQSFPPPKVPTPASGGKVVNRPPPPPKTLVVAVRSLPVHFSPARARSDAERWALDLLFEGLMRPSQFEGMTVFEPALADGFPRLTPGGLTFLISGQARWTDGSPVTSNDVLASMQLVRLGDAVGPLGDGAADSPRRLTVGLRQAHPDPAALFTFPVVPASRATDPTFDRQPIGSGPFVLDPTPPSDDRPFVSFRAHDRSRRRPALNEVRFLEASEPLADLRAGFADLALEERTQPLVSAGPQNGPVLRLDPGPDARVVTLPSRRIYYLAINPIKVALGGDAGRSLRRAVAFAINREAILNAVWRVAGRPDHRPLTGPFSPGTWPCDPDAMSLDDATLARAELKNARLPDRPLSLVYPSADPAVGQACALIIEQLRAVGMIAEARPLAGETFTRAVEADRDFDLAFRHFDFADDWFEPTGLFLPPVGGTAGARIEDALARGAARAEFSALRDARRRLHRECREAMPFVPLWTLDVHVVVRGVVETDPALERIDPLAPLRDIIGWRVNR